jgi:predicted TIM-barrel fold metal-dependent hydrolase
MKGKIAFEEHMAIAETTEETRDFAGESADFSQFTKEILDLDDIRLGYMDATGIELAILSLNAPGVQAILDTDEAIEVARKGNAAMAAAIQRHPTRYRAFAALPMQDPRAAAEELERCVKELGFVGALVNGFTQKGTPETAIYYDIPEYREFWQTVSDLDVPFYLHPRMGLPSQSKNLMDHPWLRSSPWGFTMETGTHALRLCGSGLFEDVKHLKVIIGHLGEFIPYNLWRMDARMAFSPRGYRGKRPLGDYFREHFHVTTSGNFHDSTFRCALDELGKDRLYFCADYPFERMDDAATWFDNTKIIDEEERIQIGRKNAIELFKLEI